MLLCSHLCSSCTLVCPKETALSYQKYPDRNKSLRLKIFYSFLVSEKEVSLNWNRFFSLLLSGLNPFLQSLLPVLTPALLSTSGPSPSHTPLQVTALQASEGLSPLNFCDTVPFIICGTSAWYARGKLVGLLPNKILLALCALQPRNPAVFLFIRCQWVSHRTGSASGSASPPSKVRISRDKESSALSLHPQVGKKLLTYFVEIALVKSWQS